MQPWKMTTRSLARDVCVAVWFYELLTWIHHLAVSSSQESRAFDKDSG